MAAELRPWSCVYSDCSAKIEEASPQLIDEFSISCPECGRDQANIVQNNSNPHGQEQDAVKPQAAISGTSRSSTSDRKENRPPDVKQNSSGSGQTKNTATSKTAYEPGGGKPQASTKSDLSSNSGHLTSPLTAKGGRPHGSSPSVSTSYGQPLASKPPTTTSYGQPPASKPPTTTSSGQPPASKPPTTTSYGQPPASKPPTTTSYGQPPASKPPTTTSYGQPPASKPPTTTSYGQPPASKPPTTTSYGQPPASKPPTTTSHGQPPASRPPTTTSQSKVIAKGPPCQYCQMPLLTPDATICASFTCGKSQRPSNSNGQRKVQAQAAGSKAKAKTNSKKTDPGKDDLSLWEIVSSTGLPPKLQPSQHSVIVTFHVIVPLDFWGWNEKSQICLQFGHKDLGKWSFNCGLNHFKERPVENGLSEMTCELCIPEEILRSTIAYKYLIYSSKAQDKSDWYEVIQTQHGTNPNRALCIPKDRLAKCQGHYHQYDTFAYPRSTVSWFDKGKQWFGIGGTKPSMLSTLEMRIKVLQIYLTEYMRKLTPASSSFGNISRIVVDIQHIFESQAQRFIFPKDSCSHVIENIDSNAMKSLRKIMRECCESVIREMEKNPVVLHRLVMAVVMTCVITAVGFEFSEMNLNNVCLPLCRMLCLYPNTNTTPMKCEEFDTLCTLLPGNDDKKGASKAIAKLLCSSSKEKHLNTWLLAVPVHNLLNDPSTKFGDITIIKYAELIKRWTGLEKPLKLEEIRTSTSSDYLQSLETSLHNMQSQFSLDPLLLQAVVYLYPRKGTSALFQTIPTNVSIAWLSKKEMYDALSGISSKKAQSWVEWIGTIMDRINQSKSFKEAELLALMNCSSMLVIKCSAHLSSPDSHCIQIMKAALSLALLTISVFDQNYPDTKQKKKDCKTKELERLDSAVRSWIDDKVIGKQMFGGNKHPLSSHLSKESQEIEIWEALFSVFCPSSDVLTKWLSLNRKYLKERVISIPYEELKLNLLTKINEDSKESEILMEVVFDAALEVVDKFFSETSTESAKDKLSKLAKHQSQSMGRVLGTIVARKYPSFNTTDEMTVNDLIEWYLWPNFLQIYGSTTKVKSGMSEACQAICSCAVQRLYQVCDSLKSGSITVGELRHMAEHEDQVQQLFKAVLSNEENRSMNSIFCLRLEEYHTFVDNKTKYLQICNWIPHRHCFDCLDDLKQELDQDYSKFHICDVCVKEDGSFTIKCFQVARPLDEFSNHFQIMMTNSSNLFVRPLEKRMAKVMNEHIESETNLKIADFYPLIWKPTFDNSRLLLETLANLTIKLVDCDRDLKDFTTTLDTQLSILRNGICRCAQVEIDSTRILTALSRVRMYWKLCEYRHGANIFLQLRDVLDLQDGDFSIVETFANTFGTSTSDQTLADIDESLIQTGKFLEDIANDQQKTKCLEKFVECQKVIKWLRLTTKDVSDIQGFVTVALATAAGGEDDLAHDKLSHLRTVGSGFASLIYNVKEGDGFKQLEMKCMSLWEVLQSNNNLPKLLEECNQDLDWYQSVKDRQGSVETTSYGQMRNILKYGCYRIGALSSVAKINSIHDLIKMTLEERDGVKLPKKEYFLDELRDLESKLVLICGNKTESRAEVDHYLNLLHNVQRIAEVFLDLQLAGNVEHSRSIVAFRQCASYQSIPGEEGEIMDIHAGKVLVDVLQSQAKKLEGILNDWQGTVEESRLTYYHLNCFTMLQLLTLRKDLGLFKQWTTSSIPSHVLLLLQSVSPDLDEPCVKDAVQKAVAPCTESQVLENSKEETLAPYTSTTNATESTTADAEKVKKVETKSQGPSLSLDDLNDEQKSIYTNLVESQNFFGLLVLTAFEKCRLEANEYDIAEWCDENDNLYADESESESDSESSEDEDDSEEEMLSDSQNVQPSVAQVTKAVPKKEVSSSLSIKTVTKQTIDEAHPDVQKLLGADFSLEDAIEAMERFGNLGAAMDFLESKEIDDSEAGPELLQAASNIEKPTELTGLECVSDGDQFSPRLIYDPDVSKRYLSLDELGRVLKFLSESSSKDILVNPRKFDTEFLKDGHPNLLVTSAETVLRTVLAIYMEDASLSLPTHEEVLICNSATTAEEVILLWRRAIFDPGFKRIFCLAHAENLSYQVCDVALRVLSELSQGRKGYRLVIVCSKTESDASPFISKLHLYKRLTIPQFNDVECKEYLQSHFMHTDEQEELTTTHSELYASCVDINRSCVRVVSSTRSGMGKSLYIQRMAEKLRKRIGVENGVHIIIPIHGPVVTADMLLDLFEEGLNKDLCTLYHLDIAPNMVTSVDTILFSLLILRGLSDSKGRVWRCHPRQLYAVEVTVDKSNANCQDTSQALEILKLLPEIQCISPLKVAQKATLPEDQIGMDKFIYETPSVQRVYQYLRRYIARENLDNFTSQSRVEGTIVNYLEIVLKKCEVKDPSWSEIHHFTKFLDTQLSLCESSVFCLDTDTFKGLKSLSVKFMIRMSQDFSTPSLALEDGSSDQDQQNSLENSELAKYQISKSRQWTHSSHPYFFFNRDGETITFVGVRVTKDCDLVDYDTGNVIEHSVMSNQLYTALVHNNVDLGGGKLTKKDMIQKITRVMGIFEDSPQDPDTSYVLTSDNLVKILAIQMRFRCNIPVVLMGETGCGKTRLIRYMCDLARQESDRQNMLIMKMHGGVSDKDVSKFIEKAEIIAGENKEKNSDMDTVVFFDEANTTDSIGLIKEIMCDRRINGRLLSEDLKFIAACNPYRKHTEDMINKLETAGLGFYVRETDTQQKLGKIPLRQLVYRVLDLPPSMRPLVYDFGELRTGTEQQYTNRIVEDHIKSHKSLKNEDERIIPVISAVLCTSQEYMRKRQDECSFVSLRDVERAMIILEYFYEKMHLFAPLMNQKAQAEMEEFTEQTKVDIEHPKNVTRALILAISITYHAKLQKRPDYEEEISAMFKDPLVLPRGAEQFRDEIKWCQESLLDNMRLGPNIAKNAALRENVFMMAICIELRIPLFLVGKPGSSKSLAKSIIHDSMLGKDSRTELLKTFKQVHMFSYQCSQLSTPESVIEVFKSAEKFQSTQDTDSYVSVVVLDEVGLAEDSPNLPLKALHPLLEDGTEGAGKDYEQRTVERNKRVAFIGISNWALDPAKMNRGVMVTRGDPGLQELKLSARGICSNKLNDPIRERLEGYFDPLSKAYVKVCGKQKKQFFGLRDFYSLIKMLYWMCDKSEGHPLSGKQLEHAIKRNFGGLESDTLNPVEVFKEAVDFGNSRHWYDFTKLPVEIQQVVNPDCSRLGLIKTSLSTKENTWHGENRYLLFLTENYAALDILEHYLEVGSGEDSPSEEDSDSVVPSKPFILFGSSFPKDKDYTQVCRNINQIKICMETGRTVILLNLENLYESLYDVLNQYYMYYGGVRYVDLGLQTHRVKCRVHENFKLILIAEKSTVYEKFPTPLINRLEKHFVLASTVLEDWQKEVLEDFKHWIQKFSSPRELNVEDPHFKEGHAFVGFQKDTPAAVVFQATNQLEKLISQVNPDDSPTWLRLQQIGILKDISASNLKLDTKKSSKIWRTAVMRLSQFLLIQTASEDALFRLKYSKLLDEEIQYLMDLYFHGQDHKSVPDFLLHSLREPANSNQELYMQVTTHSHLLTNEEMGGISEVIEGTVAFDLLEFDTELDFSNKISPYFHREDDQLSTTSLIVIQCDNGHQNSDLIACARYRIYDEAIQAKRKSKIQKQILGPTHVLFIVRLPPQEVRSNFVGFQGDPWISAHIDDIRQTSEATVIPNVAISATISELFIGRLDPARRGTDQPAGSTQLSEDRLERSDESISAPSKEDFYPQHCRLHGCIQAAVSALRDFKNDRTKSRLQKLISLVPRDPSPSIDNTTFYGKLVLMIYNALKERESSRIDEKEWVAMEAMNARKLHSGGTFRNVLARRIDEVITPYFSEIIADIDQTCNLDLLTTTTGNSTLTEFWLSMFSEVNIDFSSHTQNKLEILIETEFHCQLPFSWMVKDNIDGHLANTSTDVNLRAVHVQLCESLSQTRLGEILDGLPEEDCEDLFKCYLHDFVRYAYKSKHKEKIKGIEHQLVADALNGMVHAPELGSVDGHESFSRRVIALHLVHRQCRSQLLWFGELALQKPGILNSLLTKSLSERASTEFSLHLIALETILKGLGSPLKKNEPQENLSRWLNSVRLSQNMIDSILNLSKDKEIAVDLRLMWQRIRAVQMFVEHVYLPHSSNKDVISYVRRLDARLSTGSDFLKQSTLEVVKRQINNMISHLKKLDKATKKSIEKSCQSFFMEVVSSLCFGGSEAPENELIKTLVDTILCGDRTRDLTAQGSDAKPDKTPTIRSFVLQLLLEHSPQQVKESLNDYLKRSSALFGGEGVNQGLCLLCIQCFEDALHREASMRLPEEQILHTIKAAEEGYAVLKECTGLTEPTLDFLEAVAKARYALSVVADQLKSGQVDDKLMQDIEIMCTDESINTVCVSGKLNATGPCIYLLKLIIRRFGFPLLKTVGTSYPEIIPKILRNEMEQQAMNPFPIYQSLYKDVYKAVSAALYEDVKELESFLEATKNSTTTSTLFPIIFYVEASQSNLHSFNQKAIEDVSNFLKEDAHIQEQLAHMSRLLLSNNQGGPLAQMTVMPKESSLLSSLRFIVVHTTSVMFTLDTTDVLQPIVNILKNPAALINSYFPTMPEDELAGVMEASNIGHFYVCRNGHPYLVGGPGSGNSCPSPTQSGQCRECGVPIGGMSKNDITRAGGRAADRAVDTTKTGHDLGEPSNRQIPQRSDRYLSAPAVCIVRAIMHSALVWGTCNNQEAIEAYLQLVNTTVSPDNLPEYFWKHLMKDIEDLSKITSKAVEECCMIVHLVLREILTKEPIRSTNLPAELLQSCGGMLPTTLNSKQARLVWQCAFNKYIEPILENLEGRLKEALEVVSSDDKQEHSLLFYLAYERQKIDAGKLEPHMWTFRSRITVHHLRDYLLQRRKKIEAKLLNKFLDEEQNLRATQYLPDIVKLQTFLFNMFHRKLRKSEAKTKTIREFIGEIKNENTRNEYQGRIESLKKAWALVGQNLKHHNRLPVDQKHLLPAITDDTELIYLIPTTTEEGTCTTALVDFLVLTHNSFIETCRGIVKEHPSYAIWTEFKVPISHINQCHLLLFEQHLQSIILSHCHYFLTVGKGQDIQYDIPALEKHILNRFVYGKPVILLDIPHVAYRHDVYSADTFQAVRQKVKPQVDIPLRIQQDIITELQTPDRLKQSLDAVDIVLGFLSSGGGSCKVTLKKYLDTHQMKQVPFSIKAKDYCTLGHIISLWETISVELARQLWKTGQEPFEGIPLGYMRELSDDQIVELDKCLQTFDLNLLLGSLFEFVEVHIKHITADEKNWEIVEAMDFYRDETGQEQLPQFTDEFPYSITVDQAVATWKHIIYFQENIEQQT